MAATQTRTDLVLTAASTLAASSRSGRVLLSDLRAARSLAGLTADAVTEALLALEREQRVALYQLDAPWERTPAVVAAAVPNSLGFPRHLLYVVGLGGQAVCAR